jgi:hypothetical protein
VISLFIRSPLSNKCFETPAKYKYLGIRANMKIKFGNKEKNPVPETLYFLDI